MKTFVLVTLLLSSISLVGLSFSSDYDKDLHEAVKAIKSAKNLNELEQNPKGPKAYFASLESLASADIKDFCKSMAALRNDELSLFENLLDENQPKLQLTCYGEFKRRISNFQAVQSRVFYQSVAKDKAFLKQGGNAEDMAWSPFAQIKSIGPKQEHFFKGVSAVEKGSVIYQKDLVTGSSNINRLKLNHGEIVLTFDDGPHPSRTEQVAEILDRHQVKAVFFALGQNARSLPNVIKNVIAKDNIYGSHSDTHKQLTAISNEAAQKEIRDGHRSVVAAANGEDSGFFRFPYGSRNTALATFVKENFLSSFFWNMDTLDWKYSDTIVLYNHIVSEVNREQRGVILFHDVHQQTVTVLDHFLEQLYEAGYSIRVAVPNEWIEAR
ncbi:MAG: polysaccharide deacetylase family protein [Bdellovibrionales bacterium]|nr:polysaccharide deacetylase family protein [Bdellovibrionales bacterium]